VSIWVVTRKEPKDFYFCASGNIPAMASIKEQAEK
jgi:hypothetical protein